MSAIAAELTDGDRGHSVLRAGLRHIWQLVRRALAEPLVHFLLAGFLLFAGGLIYQSQTSLYRIVITPAHVAQLSRGYALQFGTPPDRATLEKLIERDVHDEILFRQGLALQLERNDDIVRRRIVQKTQFILQDLEAPAEPTQSQLQAYYAAHAARYRLPVRASFSHVYFSLQQGESAALARARSVLGNLGSGASRAPQLGDAFTDNYDFADYEPDQVTRVFGHTEFSQAVFSAPVGRWSGPVRSAYGWHLLYVSARQPPVQPPLASLRDRVRNDYLQDAQDTANGKAFENLAEKFAIIREDKAR